MYFGKAVDTPERGSFLPGELGLAGGALREGCGGPPEGRVSPKARRSDSDPVAARPLAGAGF